MPILWVRTRWLVAGVWGDGGSCKCSSTGASGLCISKGKAAGSWLAAETSQRRQAPGFKWGQGRGYCGSHSVECLWQLQQPISCGCGRSECCCGGSAGEDRQLNGVLCFQHCPRCVWLYLHMIRYMQGRGGTASNQTLQKKLVSITKQQGTAQTGIYVHMYMGPQMPLSPSTIPPHAAVNTCSLPSIAPTFALASCHQLHPLSHLQPAANCPHFPATRFYSTPCSTSKRGLRTNSTTTLPCPCARGTGPPAQEPQGEGLHIHALSPQWLVHRPQCLWQNMHTLTGCVAIPQTPSWANRETHKGCSKSVHPYKPHATPCCRQCRHVAAAAEW